MTLGMGMEWECWWDGTGNGAGNGTEIGPGIALGMGMEWHREWGENRLGIVLAMGWVGMGTGPGMAPARKFLAIQTAFHCGSQQSLISLHHWEIWSQMCLSHMGVALSTWVYFACLSTLVYFAILLLSSVCNPVNPSCSLELCLGSVERPLLHQGKARSNLSA